MPADVEPQLIKDGFIIRGMTKPEKEFNNCVSKALEIAAQYGQIDGAHP